MALFGRALEPVGNGEGRLQLAWLAGLLEAEGSFLKPTPSAPRFPIVACQMKDRDVIARVGSLFGTAVTTIPRPGRRTMYGTRIKGSRAVLLMRDLAPAMSERRRAAIEAAMAKHSPRSGKLNYGAAEVIRDFQSCVSVSRLAREFGVSRPTIRQVLDGSIYAPPEVAWRCSELEAVTVDQGSVPFSFCELYWLAGWLEGEGSFVRPPPSDPRRPRISGQTCDRDVAREVGRLLAVTPLFTYGARERIKGWSPSWRLLRRGRFGVQVMEALYPLMGARRRSQIDSALAAVD